MIDNLTKDSFLIIDSNVNNLYPQIKKSFDKKKVFIIAATEKNKSLSCCQKLINGLVERGIKKNHRLVSVGGGIVQDITGFVASVLYRGIEWVFLPTTLLAQADSCIGSKTSINLGDIKNLIGTFYPPSEIYCCAEFIETLSEKDIKSGIGEILHFYLISGSPYVNELMDSYESIFKNSGEISKHIYESLKIKQRMIMKDEFDQNERRVFNYGHTFGHAIETISNYEIPHGQAVTLGMDIANYVALKLGVLDQGAFTRMHEMLKKNMPEFKIKKEQLDLYMDALMKDKKNVDKSIVCILPHSFGDMRVKKIDDKQILRNIIEEYEKSC